MVSSSLSESRVYLALYARDGLLRRSPALKHDPARYHWALLLISADTTSARATRFHARDYYSSPTQTHWLYEEIHVDARGTPKLLSQTLVGDVEDVERLFEVLRDVSIRQEAVGWNCVSWVREGLEAIEEDGEVLGVSGGTRKWEALKRLALDAADAEKRRRDTRLKALL